MINKRKKRIFLFTQISHIELFILSAVLCGWFGVLIDYVLTDQPEGNSLGMLLWLFFPSLTVILLRGIENDWKNSGLHLHFRRYKKVYLAAILIYIVITVFVLGLGYLTRNITYKIDFGTDYLGLIITAIGSQIVKNVFEEFAWRGYLTQKLIDSRMKDVMIYLVTGLVWGLWHAPYYLVFLEDSFFTETSRWMMVLSGIEILLLWSVMYVEMYRLTKSIWPCILMHAVTNVIQYIFLYSDSGVKYRSGTATLWFDPVQGIIASVLFLLFGYLLRKIRIRNDMIKTVSE